MQTESAYSFTSNQVPARRISRMLSLLLIVLGPAFCVAATAENLASKTPYPAQESIDLPAPPPDYDYLMLQLVARHGSRGLYSPSEDDLSLQLWKAAAQRDALTISGRTLGPAIERIMAIHQDIGYGQISGLGRSEQRGIAQRAIARHPDFFEAAAAAGKRVSVSHSGRARARDSAAAFVEAWREQLPAYSALIDDARADQRTLYFHKAEGSTDYKDYRAGDERLLAVMQAAEDHPTTRRIAEEMLLRLYQPAFVAALDAGRLSFAAAADEEDRIDGIIDAARSLYSLFAVTSNLSMEQAPDFSAYVLPEHAAWLAYIDDLESFYGRGPGFADEDVTFAAAAVLIDDMLGAIRRAAQGEHDYAADVRFTHAQVMMPLATFIGIPGADQGATEETLFTYENNPWRSGWVSPMAANLQLDAFVHRETGEVIVRALHNEKQTSLRKACSQAPEHPAFYALSELERCLTASQ